MSRRRGSHRPARLLASVTLLWAALLGGPMATEAAAHPLGNFTTNTAAAVVVSPGAVEVAYAVDLAEIPALRVVQDLDADGDGEVAPAEADGHRATECAALAAGLDLTVDGRAADLAVTATDLTFPPGEAGLPTLRLTCDLHAGVGGRTVELRDGNHVDRVGWREVTATGRGVALADSDVPPTSPTDGLRRYPEDRLAAPLDVRAARLVVGHGDGTPVPGAAVTDGTAAVDGLATRFTDLVAARDLTPGFAAVAVALAVLLGGLHAVAPGHGKTVMAAVLVSREGRGRDALALALTVAVTHTLGVLVLGAALTVTEVIAPQRLYGWLGLASGLLFVAVGVSLLRAARRPHAHGPDGHHHLGDGPRRAARARPIDVAPAAGTATTRTATAVIDATATHDHDGPHGHDRGHDHSHDRLHGHDHEVRQRHAQAGPRWRTLIGPGLAGGMVPTPSALVVLLGGIAMDRTWFGVALVVAYGAGMAVVLVGAGWLLLRARDAVPARLTGGRAQRVLALLPRATATLVIVAGLLIAARAALDLATR